MTFKFKQLDQEVFGRPFGDLFESSRFGPLYNIRSESPNVSIIDVALPGFSLADIEVEVTPERKLIIRSGGIKVPGTFSVSQFNVGPFERVFSILGVVTKATMRDGVLSIRIERDTKPANIKINIEPPSADEHPQLLNEDSVI
jgi:HSP20 family molecular chaperone IbpA